MRQPVIEDIMENVLPQALHYYRVNDESVYLQDGYHHVVHTFRKNKQDYVLRITDKTHRNYEELKSELQFLHYLSNHQAPVYCPLELKKISTDNHVYYMTLFKKAIGEKWFEKDLCPKDYFYAGVALGQIHELSKNMKSRVNRRFYYENKYFQKAPIVFMDEPWLFNRLNQLLQVIHNLPKTKDTFGLVHGDYHFGNLIYNDDHVLVIDFDDCEYHYYLYDLAVYLFYYLMNDNPYRFQLESFQQIAIHFLSGYQSETNLQLDESLILFMRLREIKLLIGLMSGQSTTTWSTNYIKRAKHSIRTQSKLLIEVVKQCIQFDLINDLG